jgi:hypothetical protein
MRDVLALLVEDMGGDAVISEAQRSIARRAAVMTTELERLELSFATAGEASPKALGLYQTTANSLRRLLRDLGLKKVPKDITPRLEDIIAGRVK